MSISLKAIISKLNDTTRKVLEDAAGLCLARTHYNVEVEHFLVKLLDVPDCDFSRILKQFGVDMSIVNAAEATNEIQKPILMPRILKHFGGSLQGKTIAVWGLAFKPRTDDIREAPALVLIDKLLAEKATVRAFDPEAMSNVKKSHEGKIVFAANAYDALEGADALLLCTEWNEFRTPDWTRVKAAMRGHAVFDGRNIYKPAYLREQGFAYYGIGKQ